MIIKETWDSKTSYKGQWNTLSENRLGGEKKNPKERIIGTMLNQQSKRERKLWWNSVHEGAFPPDLALVPGENLDET